MKELIEEIKSLQETLDNTSLVPASCELLPNHKKINLVKTILKGIDQTEDEEVNEHGDTIGWWPTSTGAKFGALKLAQMEGYVRCLHQELLRVIEEADNWYESYAGNGLQAPNLDELRLYLSSVEIDDD
jgi:hypothetical protein